MEEVSLISAVSSDNERVESAERHLQNEEDTQLDVTQNDRFPRQNLQDEQNDNQEKRISSSSSTELTRFTGLFGFLFLYSALAVTSWVIICILTFRPLPKGTYVNVYNIAKPNFENAHYPLLGTRDWSLRDVYETSRRWYQAARVMQTIVAVFTLMITSMALTLADKNWLNFNFYLDLPKVKKTKSRSTKALYIFMAVTFTGVTIPPIQQILVTEITIKVPFNTSTGYSTTRTVDIQDLIKPKAPMNGRLSVTAQKIFASTQIEQIIPNLWIDENTKLSCRNTPQSGQLSQQTLPQVVLCDGDVIEQTYGNISTENPPFLTHIPAFKNTGLIKQFVPRMNSSVRYFEVDTFPSDCNEKIPGFYAEYVFNSTFYENSATWYNFSVKACSLSIKPAWTPIRDRQDIEENFYLQIKMSEHNSDYPSHKLATFHAQANTTLGWFELPNYANNNTAGPLLDKDPFPCQSDACADQTQNEINVIYKRQHDRQKENKKFMNQSSGALELSMQENIGPLALTMVALFGKESWFSLQTYMALQGFIWPLSFDTRLPKDEVCADTAPLALLNGLYQPQLFCISGETSQYYNTGAVPASWLEQFFHARRFQATLGAAVILASNVWLSIPFKLDDLEPSLLVFSDMGMSTTIPTISRASIIIVSALWGIYLTSLFALICYAVSTKVWTNSMDALTLIKLGSVLHGKIDLLPSRDESEIKALDELPGWFGDENPLEKVGRVGLGARDPLRPNRRYASYPDKSKKA